MKKVLIIEGGNRKCKLYVFALSGKKNGVLQRYRQNAERPLQWIGNIKKDTIIGKAWFHMAGGTEGIGRISQ